MTRPALLHLLANPAALTGADVRELEQLAQAFPYCQTAHLLLAKAAHDQGSMLAGQRLRRAATYATDRARLRQLIELPLAVAEPAPAPVERPLAASAREHPMAADSILAASPPAAEPLPSSSEATAPKLPPAAPEAEPVAAPLAELFPEAQADELPAVAPPIRPPAEAEAARLEFGLAAAEPADIVAYQLPELEALPAAAPDSSPPAPLAAFKGVADVGYAPDEGSRLGFCLQGTAAEYSLTSGPAALLPGALLPPAGEFFEPDALLLAHLAAQQELAAAPAPAARDLINMFLQRTPQAAPRRRALPPPPDADAENQPDLSGPSTRTVPDLASENLAKILTRQGKPDRAIAIYERLMVKHPEKMAYFAAQIESLRPQA